MTAVMRIQMGATIDVVPRNAISGKAVMNAATNTYFIPCLSNYAVLWCLLNWSVIYLNRQGVSAKIAQPFPEALHKRKG
jgi:hypothetical protein